MTKPDDGSAHEPESWSPDGKTISLNVALKGNQGVWTIALDTTDRKPKVFLDVPVMVEKHSAFSPDGRWLAYMSTGPLTSAKQEVFVQPFPPTGAKYLVSPDGGRAPLWSRDGKQLL